MKVPFDPTYRQGLLVDIVVHGAGAEPPWKLRAAVDTGASYCLIPLQIAGSLGYLPGETERERIVSADGVVRAPRIVLSRVDVGPLRGSGPPPTWKPSAATCRKRRLSTPSSGSPS